MKQMTNEKNTKKHSSEKCKNCNSLCARDIPFIDSMSDREKEILIDASTRKKISKGDFLFREGDTIDAIYIILKGSVKLVNYDADGREQIVGIFSAGETIWEGILTDDLHFPYSCVAMSDIKSCIITRESLLKVLENPRTGINIIALLSRKLHDANARNQMLSATDPVRRLAAFFIYHSRRLGNDTLEFRLDDIAASLNLRPETISRKITQLSDDGIIARSGKSGIKILDFVRLEELYL